MKNISERGRGEVCKLVDDYGKECAMKNAKDNLQIDIKKTGMKLKFLCNKRNITVKDIQKELCIGAFQSVYNWFSGKSLPSLDNMFRLSKMLGVQMEDIIEVVSKPINGLQEYQKGQVQSHLLVYYERLLKYI